jgi:heptosyltransferase III
MRRILVIRGGAIGDFVLTLPAIKLLREGFPGARLEIVAYKHIAALAENRFYAEAIRSIEYGPLASFFGRDGELNDELSHYFGSFDLVVSYLFDPDGIFHRNLQRCGVDTLIVGPPKIADSEHAAVQLARPLEQLGLTLRDRAARLYPSRDDREFAREFLGDHARPIALHPGSGSTTKNWPRDKWSALLTALRDRELLVVGGEADERQLAALRAHDVRLAMNLPLPQLAAILERCALFVGHDSGISHIAAAVGTPCVLLFGPTNPDVWAPANAGVQVLRPRSGRLADLSVEEVSRAARSLVAATQQQRRSS